MIDISVIIPQKNSLETLPRLLSSIPVSERIEIIICDNSECPIKKEKIITDRYFKLCHADSSRFAGGARNEGIKMSQGKWLIFADADDFFNTNAFDIFFHYVNDDYDLIYFKMDGVYNDTLMPSDRGQMYCNKIDDYFNGKISEEYLRLHFDTPCCKMVKRSLIENFNIKFDEVIASNDSFFSLLVGFHAQNFAVVNKVVYIATTGKGSLTRRRDLPVIASRYSVILKKNKFLKQHDLSNNQASIMNYLTLSLRFGIGVFISFVKLAIVYKQNIFIGYKNWIKSFFRIMRKYFKEKSYITK